ncbi:hypothetical protein [Synechocystis sp. PCC 7509]|uniref:hypothetical protein n=1 Tax=Synechocystis sp. PCC 7509 TaxID=927677 RepID=UPI0002ABF1DB|nr:hypothetical protein [Synechocystis sp. PCC 7509]
MKVNNLKTAFKISCRNRGFVLPIALTMGIVMILVGVAAVAKSYSLRLNTSARKQTGGSLAVAEGGVARTLAQLTKANNRVLLTGNYDAINPKTNKTYLGADGILNNGDEETTLVNQWTSFGGSSPCSAIASPGTPDATHNGSIGGDSYTLKAYRYHNSSSTGTFLVEGKQNNSVSLLKVTITVDSIISDFPGVVAVEKMELSGREVIGSNGNVYYDPAFSANKSLTAAAAPGDANRPDYLNAIKSGTNDSFSNDNVAGKIVACKLNPTFAYAPQGANLGDITDSFNLPLAGASSGITRYQAGKIDIANKTINVNTTNGSVYIYVNSSVTVKGTAKIVNFRTDGIPPKVGDLRIIISTDSQTQIDGTPCIENAFFYSPTGNLQLGGSGGGCPRIGNTNIDGVVWAKVITNTSGSNSGIAVPDDLSSLSDIASSIGLSGTKKFGSVKNWQRQQL